MLLLSNLTSCWAFHVATRTWGHVIAQVGTHAFRVHNTDNRQNPKCPPLPLNLTLKFDEDRVESHVDLLQDGQPLGRLHYHEREEVSPLLVNNKVYLLGDAENEVFDLDTNSSRALALHDVGQEPFAVSCDAVVVTVSKYGKISLLEDENWIGSLQLDVLPVDAEVQGVCASPEHVFIKLPLMLVVLDVRAQTTWTVDAPWLLKPRLAFTQAPVSFMPCELEPVCLVPTHAYDSAAAQQFAETGQTTNPAAVVSACVRNGDVITLRQVLAQFDVDRCLFSREMLLPNRTVFCAFHQIVLSKSPEVHELVRLHLEKRTGPRLYATPAYFCFDSWLSGVDHFTARTWIECLRKVFVNADEFVRSRV